MTFRFPKEEKLKSKTLIQKIFDEGSAVSNFPLKVLYVRTNAVNGVKLKVGVAVPKKNFKSAVHRNRVKRLLRESYRLNKDKIFNKTEGSYALLFLYLGKDIPEYKAVEKNMLAIFERLIKKLNNEENTE
jgi:ribonuclease P protein component